MDRSLIVAFASIVLLAGPARAQSEVPVTAFKSIALNGPGHVVVRHGPAQRVRLLSGSAASTRITVQGEHGSSSTAQLVIEACAKACPRGYTLEVEVVTPLLAGVAVTGGGRVESVGSFPARASLAAAVTGGGTIDFRSAPAARVVASVTDGGTILARPDSHLMAAVSGRGEIRYWGDPAVQTAVQGKGQVIRVAGE